MHVLVRGSNLDPDIRRPELVELGVRPGEVVRQRRVEHRRGARGDVLEELVGLATQHGVDGHFHDHHEQRE